MQEIDYSIREGGTLPLGEGASKKPMQVTKEQQLLIANAVFDANTESEILKELIDDFIESYIGGKAEQETLKFDLEYRPKRVEAKMFTIFEKACHLSEELSKLAM